MREREREREKERRKTSLKSLPENFVAVVGSYFYMAFLTS